MSSGSSDVTIGYKYFLGVHMALAHGPLDNINRIEVDRRIAWEGVNEGTSITVDSPELFGGDEREGGVSGTVDVEMGLPSQTQNSYLLSVLGNDLPAFRGVAATVLNQCYMGNNPYMKPWAFRAQRIFVTTNGEVQWYSAKAGIQSDCGDAYSCSSFSDYLAATSSVTNLWPLETSTYTGTPSRFYTTEDIIAGDDAEILINAFSYHISSDTITDGCNGGSWRKLPSGSHLGMAHYLPTGSGASSMGILHKFSAGSEGLLWRETNVTIGGAPSTPLRVTFSPKNSSGDISLFYFGVDTPTPTEETATWASIGMDPTDTHWYHLNSTITVTGGPGAWLFTITAEAYIDGVKVLSGTKTKTGSTGSTIATTDGYAYYSYSNISGDHNFAYYGGFINEGSAEILALTEAWDRNQSGYTPDGCYTCSDMNPSHIIRECLTDTAWGMGYSSNDIDDTAFTAAADTLYTEAMGISLLWHKEMPLEDFIAEILRHIDGVLYVDRTTGKFVLNLIRDDYQADTAIVVLDETNVASISNAKRPTTGELTSSVTVNFWDRTTGETGSVTEHNWPLIQIQGAQTHTTIQYPGFTNYTIAQQAALRDLAALSTPLLSCRIEAGRDAAELNVGDAFVLDWPDLEINSLVMRVNQMTLGDNRDNTIIIEAVEDSFALPVARSETPEDGIWTDPVSGTPNDSVPRVVTEAPYYEVVRKNGEINTNDIISNNAGAGFILVAGGRQGKEKNALLHVDSGSGYVKRGIMDFSPYAYLSAPIGETDTQIYIIGGADLDLVSTPSIAQIGDELVRVDEIGTDSNGQYVVVGRGILDTVPAAHGLDSNTLDSNHTNQEDYIIFWDEDAASDSIEYSASESVSAKLQTVLGSSTMALDVAPVDSVTFNSRAVRPYPPGNLQIDGEAYPEANTSSEIYFSSNHTISWAYRDRLQQTDGNLYDYTTGNIGPESGTTYRIDIYSTLQDGSVTDPWWTVDAGQVTSYEMDSNTDTSRGEAPPDTESVHIKVTAVRDGYDSWQSPVATLSYVSDSNA